jgi:hypothetical protein
MRSRYLSRTIRGLALTGVALALNACMIFMRPPKNPQAYDRTQASTAHLYRATFAPMESMKVGKLHSWNIQVTTLDGAPVKDARVTVDGGMPQHGHGLPTKPIVSQPDSAGLRIAEGMKFNMGGWWVVRLHIDGAKGSDVVTFNLKL